MSSEREDAESLAVVLDLFAPREQGVRLTPRKGRPSRRVVAVARDMEQGRGALVWPPPPDDDSPSAA